MIQILGMKRILVLVFLLALNVALGAGVYMYLVPETTKQERALYGLRGKVNTLQADISRLQVEFDQLENQQAEFDVLKEKGFFGSQGRRQAEILFEKIQRQAGIVSAVANIRAGEVEDNEEAKKAEHAILSSPIEVSLEALSDTDVYKYIYLLDRFFPGHVTLDEIELERTSEITGAILRSIASGGNPVLVKATLKMTWRTMIPEAEVIQKQGEAL